MYLLTPNILYINKYFEINIANLFQPDWYITIHIKNIPAKMFHSRDGRNPVVIFGLMPHEQKMSVLNVVLKRPSTVDFDEPIKSKTNLIFQCGFRRFTAEPIFSQHTNGNKFKVNMIKCCFNKYI